MATTTTQTSDAAGERRRARDQRGLRSTQAMKTERLPSPPRQRRPALAALAVLLIVGGAAVAALLAMRVDSRVPVLQANQTIYPGQQLTADMFGTTQVASEGTALIPESGLEQVLAEGYYAGTTITQGQLLDSTMLSPDGFLDGDKVAVGAALAVGRYPAGGLQQGDLVDLVRVTDNGAAVFVRGAQISSSPATAAGDEGATAGTGTVMELTLMVERDDAAAVAAANMNNQLAIVLVDRGGVAAEDEPADADDDADPTPEPTTTPTAPAGD